MNDSTCYYCTHCGLVSFREIACKGDDGKCYYCHSELKEYDLKPIEAANGRGNVNYNQIEKMIYKDFIFNQPEFDLKLFMAEHEYKLDDVFNEYNLSIPVECPYCHARNAKKISTAGRLVSFGLFGFGSSKMNGKQWHCNTCKSDF